MANKPALKPAGKLAPRDRIWLEVRTRRAEFGVEDIASATKIKPGTVYDYLRALAYGGFLTATGLQRKGEAAPRHKRERRNRGLRSQFAAVRYDLARDVGVEAPRLDRHGRPLPPDTRSNLWRAMKALKVFDFRELADAAGTEELPVKAKCANAYCLALALAGYLQVLSEVHNMPRRYRLARNTGPLAPQVLRVKHVYDPNLGEVVWHPEAHS